mmetsp:Transcript_17511/g.35026  ORF Transcript_17511/g.35026 Transcript_17511/m.35026 type:complete len:106 (+) Transcript_17511:47-364(+)
MYSLALRAGEPPPGAGSWLCPASLAGSPLTHSLSHTLTHSFTSTSSGLTRSLSLSLSISHSLAHMPPSKARSLVPCLRPPDHGIWGTTQKIFTFPSCSGSSSAWM